MLCAPVLDDRGRVIAVIQALNKAPHRDGGGGFGMGGGGKDGEPVRVFLFWTVACLIDLFYYMVYGAVCI